MDRLLLSDRKPMVNHTTALYNHADQKSISDSTACHQQQATTLGCTTVSKEQESDARVSSIWMAIQLCIQEHSLIIMLSGVNFPNHFTEVTYSGLTLVWLLLSSTAFLHWHSFCEPLWHCSHVLSEMRPSRPVMLHADILNRFLTRYVLSRRGRDFQHC